MSIFAGCWSGAVLHIVDCQSRRTSLATEIERWWLIVGCQSFPWKEDAWLDNFPFFFSFFAPKALSGFPRDWVFLSWSLFFPWRPYRFSPRLGFLILFSLPPFLLLAPLQVFTKTGFHIISASWLSVSPLKVLQYVVNAEDWCCLHGAARFSKWRLS